MVTSIDSEKFLRRGQAARYLQVSEERVSQLIRSGRIPTVRTALGHLISIDDLEVIRREREQRIQGRMKKHPRRGGN